MISIAAPSAEFYQLNQIPNKNNIQRGRWAELYVLLILVKKGYRLISGGRRTPFGQVDLILRRPAPRRSGAKEDEGEDEGLIVLEVKTVRTDGHFETRVTAKQRLRLARVCAWLFEQENGKPTQQLIGRSEAEYPRLFFVFVNPERRKLYFFEGEDAFDSALR